MSPMRLAAALLAFVALVAACGPRSLFDGPPIALSNATSTTHSDYTGTQPKIELVKNGEHWTLTAYEGQQSTGGHAIAIERMTTHGTVLYVRARFTVPARDIPVSQVMTSPAFRVDLPFAPDAVLLFDQDEHERARLDR